MDSTSAKNFFWGPWVWITRPLSRRPTSCLPAVNVPMKQSFWAFWVMSIKPPGPTIRPWKLEAFTLPYRSTSAKPSTAMSKAPPS